MNLEVAKKFYDKIPKTLKENLEFRKQLHSRLAESKQEQEYFLELCRTYLPIMFATTFFTLNPQKESGKRNLPFIPWSKKQERVIYQLDKAIRKQKYNFGLEKTRKQGATEIVTKVFAAHLMLYEYSNFIVGSRVKNLVDNTGDFYTIFAKIDHVFNHLPAWMGIKSVDESDKIERKDMSIKYVPTNSTINGETTNESFKAGSRSTALFLDEFGRVDKKIAEAIDGSIHDVCNCVVYGSTHWLGPNHTFNKCIKNPRVHTETLYWWENELPHKEVLGLWEVLDNGLIRIIDKDYYKEHYPSFNWDGDINPRTIPESFIYEEIDDDDEVEGVEPQTIRSLMDLEIPNLEYKLRSLWHNYEYIDRTSKPGGKRDFYCNIAGSPFGSADNVFDLGVIEQVEAKVMNPIDEGTLINYFDCPEFSNEEGIYDIKLYYPLDEYGKLPQTHNYIIGVDISWGQGSSNSVVEVLDRNTMEQVLEYANPNIKPEALAEFVVNLAEWVGGVDEPYLIWESNGGQGVNFEHKVTELGYFHCYTQLREDSKTRKKTDKLGWRSNPTMKEWLLGNMNAALDEGLCEKPSGQFLRIFGYELCQELKDYMFSEDGEKIVTSQTADMSTGARKRHGDRVIPMALCLVGVEFQPKGELENIREAPVGSFKYYERLLEQQKAEERRTGKKYLY